MSCRLEFYYDIQLEFDTPVCQHAFVLRCLPKSFSGQQVLDATLKLHPGTNWTLQEDSFGNLLQIGRIDSLHSQFHYSVQGSAITTAMGDLPIRRDAIYRYPSKHTAVNQEMLCFLDCLHLPSEECTRAWELSEAVHAFLHYAPGSTSVSTTAIQAFQRKNGVCQDYAHIYLALARQAGLTARYCNGLTVGEGASHAWCEVLVSGVWVGIDPTRGKWTDESYLRFNIGRDFADCPMERGIFIGNAGQKQTVFMQVIKRNQI